MSIISERNRKCSAFRKHKVPSIRQSRGPIRILVIYAHTYFYFVTYQSIDRCFKICM